MIMIRLLVCFFDIWWFIHLFISFLIKFCSIKFQFFDLYICKITVSYPGIHYRYTTCFPANFMEYFRINIFKNTSGMLLL